MPNNIFLWTRMFYKQTSCSLASHHADPRDHPPPRLSHLHPHIDRIGQMGAYLQHPAPRAIRKQFQVCAVKIVSTINNSYID